MNIIVCNSPVEMLSNIESNTKLILHAGTYDISNLQLPYDRDVYYIDTNVGPYGDRELILRNLVNLSISGQDNVSIVNKFTYANILTFVGCDNIILDNLSLGHFPEMGGCRGGVLVFQKCRNIIIRNCVLFGCGTIGISCVGCSDITVSSGKITKCNTELIYLNDCENVSFDNLEITDNETREIIILHSDNIGFNKCIISRNKKTEWASADEPVFYIGNSSGRIMLKSTEVDAEGALLVNDPSRIVVI